MKLRASRLHLALVILWVALILPTFFWWRESIFWVAFLSLYANVATHWGAYEASKAKERAQYAEEMLEKKKGRE